MKLALVTGAGAGLGAAIARRLAADGYRLALVDRDRAGIERLAQELPGALACVADVTDEQGIEAMLDGLGAVPHALVNNAGIVRFGPLLEHSVADFRKVIDVNLIGTFIVSQAVGRRMASRSRTRSGADGARLRASGWRSWATSSTAAWRARTCIA